MATETPPRGKRIKEMEVMVADVVTETPDTSTLVLFTGNDRLEYKAGHFLTIDPHQFAALDRFTKYLEDLKGKREPPRAYSLASAPHEKYIAITVKEEEYVSGQTKYPPLLSPLLVRRTAPGTRLTITGFTGPYVLPEDIETRTDHIVHIVAGSGSVPNFAIIKDCLHTGKKLRHTVLFSNKTAEDMLFRRLLEELEREHATLVRVVHTLTREQNPNVFSSNVRKGRMSQALIQELVPDLDKAYFYVCGPAVTPWDRKAALEQGVSAQPKFMETVLGYLHTLGVVDARIKRESWG